MIKVFIDASVLFAAIYSDKGYSFDLLKLVKQNKIIGIVSQTVIEEVERNISKMKSVHLKNIANFVAESRLLVLEKINADNVKPYLSLVHEKDAHVLFGAEIGKCDYLVTFDEKHLNNPQVKNKIHWVKIISPKKLMSLL